MFNFIRFDIYKLLHMRATWISFFLFSLVLGINVYVGHKDIEKPYNDYIVSMTSINDEDEEESSKQFAEINFSDSESILSEKEYELMIQEKKNALKLSNKVITNFDFTFMFVYILFAIFIGKDFSSGYFKNILAIKGAKWKWVTAKVFVASVVYFITQIISFAFSLVGAGLTKQLDQPFAWQEYLTLMFPQILMYSIIMLFLVFLNVYLQSKITVIVVAVLMGSGLHNPLIGFIDNFLNINITSLLFSNKLMTLRADYINQALPVIGVGLIYLLMLYCLNRWYIYRTDFKFDH
ncbi:hypothetical protein [Facklamia sp. 7083-14-GEN3]|uniref:hypothetical protein n=1 Tax=Facklamia sp. 7083-14-GEN3 TaxID=2973478 RepID=UPI00215CF21D|nr:hypothetical protein [Facklamia sp. 7083-14-GEN3]MCR8969412.1 hypothetical protein [Facklamia sp. 7083-14-GEN3]